MPRVDFSELPDHGRLWVFPIRRALTPSERERSEQVVDDFLATWAAHGVPLRSSSDFVEDRFLLVGVDIDAESPSGCSIDALVNRLRAHGEELGTTFIDHAPVWYRGAEGIECVSRPDFKALAREGVVSPDTHVFDTSLTKVADVRAGALEKPARESWHGRAFFQLAPRG